MQTKLQIGQVNDLFEQEADRVAEHVMRMPHPAQSSAASGENVLQRKGSARKEEENKEEHEKLARKETQGAAWTCPLF
jgi:hypothetical protein